MKKNFFVIFLLMILCSNAYGNTDCSKIKKISKEYLRCLTKKTQQKSSELGLDISNVKEKKYLSDWFKKKK